MTRFLLALCMFGSVAHGAERGSAWCPDDVYLEPRVLALDVAPDNSVGMLRSQWCARGQIKRYIFSVFSAAGVELGNFPLALPDASHEAVPELRYTNTYVWVGFFRYAVSRGGPSYRSVLFSSRGTAIDNLIQTQISSSSQDFNHPSRLMIDSDDHIHVERATSFGVQRSFLDFVAGATMESGRGFVDPYESGYGYVSYRGVSESWARSAIPDTSSPYYLWYDSANTPTRPIGGVLESLDRQGFRMSLPLTSAPRSGHERHGGFARVSKNGEWLLLLGNTFRSLNPTEVRRCDLRSGSCDPVTVPLFDPATENWAKQNPSLFDCVDGDSGMNLDGDILDDGTIALVSGVETISDRNERIRLVFADTNGNVRSFDDPASVTGMLAKCFKFASLPMHELPNGLVAHVSEPYDAPAYNTPIQFGVIDPHAASPAPTYFASVGTSRYRHLNKVAVKPDGRALFISALPATSMFDRRILVVDYARQLVLVDFTFIRPLSW